MAPYLKCFICILLFSCFILSACTNEYEKRAIGYYKVDKLEMLDNTNGKDLPTLVLNKDKTFVMTFNNKKISGKWEADNYGDFTVADFTFGTHQAQGELFGQQYEKMQIFNPLDFNINAKAFSFKRVEKLSH